MFNSWKGLKHDFKKGSIQMIPIIKISKPFSFYIHKQVSLKIAWNFYAIFNDTCLWIYKKQKWNWLNGHN